MLAVQDDKFHTSKYEDRTSRFFPPPPRAPRAPGLVPGETGFMDESENLSQELSNSSHQRFNILCSADKDGIINFSIFGIFPIGKIVSLFSYIRYHFPYLSFFVGPILFSPQGPTE